MYGNKKKWNDLFKINNCLLLKTTHWTLLENENRLHHPRIDYTTKINQSSANRLDKILHINTDTVIWAIMISILVKYNRASFTRVIMEKES